MVIHNFSTIVGVSKNSCKILVNNTNVYIIYCILSFGEQRQGILSLTFKKPTDPKDLNGIHAFLSCLILFVYHSVLVSFAYS